MESYEQKYKETLERAKKLQETCNSTVVVGWCEYIFPELKESEDERIRKELIDYHRSMAAQADDYVHEAWIAWLEKQGEQKLTDKPKFKVGNCIVDNCGYVWKIEGILNQFYILEGIEGGESRPTIERVNKTFHLWTIADAKDGDILVGKIDGDNYILIFKQIKDGWIETYGHYYNAVDRFCAPSQLFCKDYKGAFYLATKEQCNLLLQKMHEAGYTFDFDKKELKKIEQKPATMSIDEAIEHCKEKSCGNNACALEHKQLEKWLTELKELKEQKPAWSEEDEVKLQTCIDRLQAESLMGKVDTVMTNWLKSLKERINGKQ